MRKKVLRCFVTGLLISSCCFAQSNQVGLKIGASVPDIKGNTEQSKDYTSRLGPFFGISFTKKISSFINLQTEINYSPQGGKRNGLQPIEGSFPGVPEGTLLYANFKNETKLNYLEVPVLLQLYGEKPKNNYALFYFVNFGPYAAARLSAKTVTSGSSSIYLNKEGTTVLTTTEGNPYPPQVFKNTTNIKDEIKRISAGITGSIGTGYNLDGNKFFVEARFTRGLINIQTSPFENGKNKTGSLIFAAGYMFGL